MIKYAKIPEYTNLGEVPVMMSHLYQFIKVQDKHQPIIFVRAYDVPEPLIWHGYLFMNDCEYQNLSLKGIDLSDVKKILGDVKEIKDFKEFIKGHYMESYFDPFKNMEVIDS